MIFLNITNKLIEVLSGWGMEQKSASILGQTILFILLLLLSYLAYRITWYLMRKMIIPLIQKSKNQFDDLLLKHYFFRKISFLVPALILFYDTDNILINMPGFVNFLMALINVFFVFITEPLALYNPLRNPQISSIEPYLYLLGIFLL